MACTVDVLLDLVRRLDEEKKLRKIAEEENERLKKEIVNLNDEVEEAITYLNGTAPLYHIESIPRPITSENLDEIEKKWCALPGFGPWTAQVSAMRVLGHDDAMPSSDLGILRSIDRLTNNNFGAKELASRSTIWKPFRSWVAQHLWQAPEVLRSTS